MNNYPRRVIREALAMRATGEKWEVIAHLLGDNIFQQVKYRTRVGFVYEDEGARGFAEFLRQRGHEGVDEALEEYIGSLQPGEHKHE